MSSEPISVSAQSNLPRRRALRINEAGDLLLIAALAILAPLLVLLPVPGLLRVPLGLALVLFVPGYALSAAAFPQRADLDGIARAGLSLGLSLAAIPLLALLLDRLPWGLRPLPIALGLMGWTLLFTLVALVRRVLARPEAAQPDQGLGAWWRQVSLRERWLIGGGLLAVGTLVGLSLAVALNPVPQPLTEFYALGSEGLAESYPRELAVGEQGQVTVGITNREGRPLRYRIELREGADLLATRGPLELADGATWQEPVAFSLATPGADRRVELLLFVDGRSEPYRRLALWLNVREQP